MNNVYDLIMCIGSCIYFLLWLISTIIDLKYHKTDLAEKIFFWGAGIFTICGFIDIVLYLLSRRSL